MVALTTEELTKTLGAADAYALISTAFTYPGSELAEALADGTFLSDLDGSLQDMGIDETSLVQLRNSLSKALDGKSAEELLETMRPEYTELYYGPGKFRKMFPYESAFKKLQINPNGRATIFMTKSTHDVERSMKRKGAMPSDARREPADFFATELDFVRHLLTGYAAASLEDADADTWKTDLETFFENHVSSWVPALLSKTKEVTNLDLYQALAECGLLVIESTRKDILSR